MNEYSAYMDDYMMNDYMNIYEIVNDLFDTFVIFVNMSHCYEQYNSVEFSELVRINESESLLHECFLFIRHDFCYELK